MRERGRYQIQCMKSRSSTGVGQKIDLEYNIETMRITDPGLDEMNAGDSMRKPAAIMDQIKSASRVSATTTDSDTGEITPKIGADLQSNKLKQMLNQIKSGAA
jgi:hypothetical protein